MTQFSNLHFFWLIFSLFVLTEYFIPVVMDYYKFSIRTSIEESGGGWEWEMKDLIKNYFEIHRCKYKVRNSNQLRRWLFDFFFAFLFPFKLIPLIHYIKFLKLFSSLGLCWIQELKNNKQELLSSSPNTGYSLLTLLIGPSRSCVRGIQEYC